MWFVRLHWHPSCTNLASNPQSFHRVVILSRHVSLLGYVSVAFIYVCVCCPAVWCCRRTWRRSEGARTRGKIHVFLFSADLRHNGHGCSCALAGFPCLLFPRLYRLFVSGIPTNFITQPTIRYFNTYSWEKWYLLSLDLIWKRMWKYLRVF